MSKPRDGPGGGGAKRGRKVRVDFRRNIGKVARDKRWTHGYQHRQDEVIDAASEQSIRAKGALSRRRTIIEDAPETDRSTWLDGVVIAMHGLASDVDAGGRVWRCSIRRVLRSRLMAERGPLAVGDRVRFAPERMPDHVARPEPRPPDTRHPIPDSSASSSGASTGVIEEVLPRRTTLIRQYEHRVQVIAANVDQAIIVAATADPPLRPHLIDRFLVAAHHGGLRPVIVINKLDAPVDARTRDMIMDVRNRYRALGYSVLGASAVTGHGIDELRAVMKGQTSVIIGVSGVGKTSLLNAVQPGLARRVGELSAQSARGQHTTTTAELVPLEIGGYVVDTPGLRQFELAHVESGDLEAYFIEFIDRVAKCRFPDCRHLDEEGCAIRAAVDAGEIHPDRYASYVRMFTQRAEDERL